MIIDIIITTALFGAGWAISAALTVLFDKMGQKKSEKS